MFSPAALDEMHTYPWPGNVRELQNCIERAVILCDGDTIHPRHLSLSLRPGSIAAPVSPWDQIDLSGTMLEATRRVTTEVERRKVEIGAARGGGEQAAGRRTAADQLQVTHQQVERIRHS